MWFVCVSFDLLRSGSVLVFCDLSFSYIGCDSILNFEKMGVSQCCVFFILLIC